MQTRKFLLIRQRDTGKVVGVFSFLNEEERNESSYKILKYLFDKDSGFFKNNRDKTKDIDPWHEIESLSKKSFIYSGFAEIAQEERPQLKRVTRALKKTSDEENKDLEKRIRDTQSKYDKAITDKINNIIYNKEMSSAYSILKYVLAHKTEVVDFFEIEEIDEGMNLDKIEDESDF